MKSFLKAMTKKHLQNLRDMAWQEASKSPCHKKKVGAVLVNSLSLEPMSVGFGGAEVPCVVCKRKTLEWQQDGCYSMHSELRAMFNCMEQLGFQRSMFNCFMIVTHGPCDQCLKYMSYFKIPLVVYDVPYHNDYSKWDGIIEVKSLEQMMEESR